MPDSTEETPSVEEPLLPPNTPVFGTRQTDIRLGSEGKGIIEIDTREIAYEFTVDGEQVQEFASQLAQTDRKLKLERPDCVPDSQVKVPDGWEGGTAVHTGGGFWLRKFKKPYLDGFIEVAFNVTNLEGVSAGAFDSDGYWSHDIAHRSLPKDADEPEALALAHELIEEIDSGEYNILGGD